MHPCVSLAAVPATCNVQNSLAAALRVQVLLPVVWLLLHHALNCRSQQKRQRGAGPMALMLWLDWVT
jgi:hypothetical protein